ncbi:transcriptional regulator (plasmid) [Pontibacillus sp. ALD_SL1]|uniref:helix-turn-helix domain-containing protein n=1 Tax=Pontibacillus sp. ALD_SL1 TaxID=2777185 RepID=UPI001A97A658|nr:helix-turn-helix domain-containing protein [Pontibacillus sp. ALD_SL1]QST02439.1 transcriptional regulator [Pontibacillus sp. ALD_SL1]
MIKTERAYKRALEDLETQQNHIHNERKRFEDIGLTEDQIQQALEPLHSFKDLIKEEISFYESATNGEFPATIQLSEIGVYLIAYRIYKGINQSELATKLNVLQSQVARDEKNEYYGASIEKMVNVMKAIGMEAELTIIS